MFIIYHAGAYPRYIARELHVSSYFPNENIRSMRRNIMTTHVNWGCGPRLIEQYNQDRMSRGFTGTILNRDISVSVRKMRTFAALDTAGIDHPRVVTDPHVVLPDDPRPFYRRGRYLGRTDGLTGGAGITVYEKGQLPQVGVQHDFYSQVVSKVHEIRLHVAGGEVICEQIKFVPAGSSVLIRNFQNGARFSARPLETRLTTEDAQRARNIAVQATTACGLDFGALDMALTQSGRLVVFEINSAPGITPRADEGTPHDMVSSYEAYRNYFRQFVIEPPRRSVLRRRRG